MGTSVVGKLGQSVILVDQRVRQAGVLLYLVEPGDVSLHDLTDPADGKIGRVGHVFGRFDDRFVDADVFDYFVKAVLPVGGGRLLSRRLRGLPGTNDANIPQG